MPSRREVKQQVIALQSDIRRMARGAASSSQMLPPVRELAQDYGISYSLVAQSLKVLAEEGVIYSVPRVGSFVGRPQSANEGTYLLLVHLPETNCHCGMVQVGFEERIAQLGGECLTLQRDQARLWLEAGKLPEIAGAFYFQEIESLGCLWEINQPALATVNFGELSAMPAGNTSDMVYFDNVKGGQQAAQHLLDAGHTQIAFLGLHGKQDEPGLFLWSKEREQGWQMAMENAGLSTKNRVSLPNQTPTIDHWLQTSVAHQTSLALLQDSQITAVVATNSFAAYGLFDALNASGIPNDRWPVVVCFDTEGTKGQSQTAHVTTLRLPWEDIGRSAADLLWERNHESSDEQPRQRLVPMRLIRRMTSRRSWAMNMLPAVTPSSLAHVCSG